MEEKYIQYLKETIIKKIETMSDLRFLQIIYDLITRNASS